MKQCKGFLDGLAAFVLAVQAVLLAVLVIGWATGADLPYEAMCMALFTCGGFAIGWSCRKSNE